MENKDETYNGWKNWDTWNCHLHLTNDEDTYRVARRCRHCYHLASYWIDCFEGTDGIITSEVDFQQIYDSLRE